LSSRPGRIFWYSGESYQRLNAALSANSTITMRFGSGPPFDQFGGAAPCQEAAAILRDHGGDRRPLGLHRFLVGDLEFDDEIGRHVRLPWLPFAGLAAYGADASDPSVSSL
jgi:hypothetical protein